jgi:hypothetical protein
MQDYDFIFYDLQVSLFDDDHYKEYVFYFLWNDHLFSVGRLMHKTGIAVVQPLDLGFPDELMKNASNWVDRWMDKYSQGFYWDLKQ